MPIFVSAYLQSIHSVAIFIESVHQMHGEKGLVDGSGELIVENFFGSWEINPFRERHHLSKFHSIEGHWNGIRRILIEGYKPIIISRGLINDR